jgi:ABC-2 type transport system permease protein
MNVFKYELKTNFRSALIWSIVIMLLITVTLSFYPLLKEDMSMIVNMLKNYPEGLQKAFGMDIEIIDTIIGFYASLPLAFLLICGTLEAMLLGVTVTSKEIKDKTADFLFTKPITRATILFSKIGAILTLLMGFGIIIFIYIFIMLNVFSSKAFDIKLFLLLAGVVLMLQIFFLSLGALIGIISKKIKSPIGISMAVVFSLYAFNSFIEDKMRFLVPYKYFDKKYIFENNNYELGYLLLMFILIIIFTAVSYRVYLKKDINAI